VWSRFYIAHIAPKAGASLQPIVGNGNADSDGNGDGKGDGKGDSDSDRNRKFGGRIFFSSYILCAKTSKTDREGSGGRWQQHWKLAASRERAAAIREAADLRSPSFSHLSPSHFSLFTSWSA
jgi:hypothetical protein